MIAFLHRETPFPDPRQAEDNIGGLVAMGGDLSPDRLLAAYRTGIFPWFQDDAAPVLWWCPDPRAVLAPDAMRVSRSLQKRLRNGGFSVSFDRAFGAVVRGCAERPSPLEPATGALAPPAPCARSGSWTATTAGTGMGSVRPPPLTRVRPDTWITPNMQRAYCRLHELGHAHSVEVWHGDALAGGLYGLAIGDFFFGESMFSRMRDASKIAFFHLCQQLTDWRFRLIDCQLPTDHLCSLGARVMPRRRFLDALQSLDEQRGQRGLWRHIQAGGRC